MLSKHPRARGNLAIDASNRIKARAWICFSKGSMWMASRNYIGESQIPLALRAICYAEAIGKSLNEEIAVNLGLAGVKQPAQAWVTHFLSLAGDWLMRRECGLYYVRVLENPIGRSCGDCAMGEKLNLHILIHIPEEIVAEFRRKLIGWAKHISPLRGPSGSRKWNKIVHSSRIVSGAAITGYLMKGASPSMCERLGIDHRSQGTIIDKRVAVSESLGVAAMRRFPMPTMVFGAADIECHRDRMFAVGCLGSR